MVEWDINNEMEMLDQIFGYFRPGKQRKHDRLLMGLQDLLEANPYHINILGSSTVEKLVEKTFQNYGRAKIFEHSTENCIDLDRIMHPIVRDFGRYSRPLLKSMYAAIEGIDDPADIPNVCYKLGCISNKSARELEDEDKLEREQKVENKSGE